jgi:sigma-E factor negative regulatory protein RseC
VIEESARVVAVGDGHVWVEAERKSACGSCSVNKGCGTSVLGKLFGGRHAQLRAIDPIGVGLGDEVVLGVREDALVRGSLAVYAVPLLALVAGALIAALLLPAAPASEPWIALAGLAGLGSGLGWLRWFGNRISRDPRYQPIVLRRIHRIHVPGDGVLAP